MVKIIEIFLFRKVLKWFWDMKEICFDRVRKLVRKYKLLRDCKKYIGFGLDIIF